MANVSIVDRDWLPDELGDYRFVAASASQFSHVPISSMMFALENSLREPGITIEVEQDGDEFFNREIPEGTFLIGIVEKIKGFELGFRILGDGSKTMHWKNIGQVHSIGWGESKGYNLFIPVDEDLDPEKRGRLAKECTGVTIPKIITECLNDQSEQVRKDLGKAALVSTSVWGMCTAEVTNVAASRVEFTFIPESGKGAGAKVQKQKIWLDATSELVIPRAWEGPYAQPQSAFFESIKKAFDESQEAHAPIFLEFLDQLKGTFHVGILTRVRPDGYLFVTKYSGITLGSKASRHHDDHCFHFTSPCLLPFGTCETQLGAGGKLENTFTPVDWKKTTVKLPQRTVPLHLLRQNHPNAPMTEFKTGMKLEFADVCTVNGKMETIMRKATAADTWRRFVKIHFDGWDFMWDRWVPDTSSEIYPVGWCTLVGNPEPLMLPPEGSENPARIWPNESYYKTPPSQWSWHDLKAFLENERLGSNVSSVVEKEQLDGSKFLSLGEQNMEALFTEGDAATSINSLLVIQRYLRL